MKIDEKWYLIDSTWGAGSVDDDRKYNREFDDYYFLTPPKKFIYNHFPGDSEWQLLEKPLSKGEFEDLVYIRPAFSKLGIMMGNQKNVTIISNGQAKLALYSSKEVSLMVKLDKLSNSYSMPRLSDLILAVGKSTEY